jgi:ATPase subunit of ABC transporter with duplicated ATPase domains
LEQRQSASFYFDKASGKYMISVRDLEIRIGARVLMQGVNFRVDKGDKVGLVGRNGAGKTTLTKILAGDGHQRGSLKPAAKLVTYRKTQEVATQKNSPEPAFSTLAVSAI